MEPVATVSDFLSSWYMVERPKYCSICPSWCAWELGQTQARLLQEEMKNYKTKHWLWQLATHRQPIEEGLTRSTGC